MNGSLKSSTETCSVVYSANQMASEQHRQAEPHLVHPVLLEQRLFSRFFCRCVSPRTLFISPAVLDPLHLRIDFMLLCWSGNVGPPRQR